jgi:hypothetical protein
MPRKKLIGYDVHHILDLVTLDRRRTIAQFILPAVGLVALGLAVGGGVGLMLAPSSGRRLRQDMGGRLGQLRERLKPDRRNPEMVNATPHQQG